MLNTAIQSRKDIYREAAELFLSYRRIINYDLRAAEAKKLLADTFVKPDAGSTLFELYWIIKIIKSFDRSENTINFKLIRHSQSLLAEWDMNGQHFQIYHDTVEPFGFSVDLKNEIGDIEKLDADSYLFRSGKIFEEFDNLSQNLFGKGAGDSLWGGRPDIILTVTPDGEDKPDQVFIGEVKYTESEDYARQGLKELLEYMAFIKENKEYLDQRDSDNNGDKEAVLNSPRINGLLFTDKIGLKKHDSNKVRIFEYGQKNFPEELTKKITTWQSEL
jgi:hypothetical protein